ncbi:hypothetical protein V6N11_071168 [Hibiscus sabdariffa]|uniref:Reverse transcriptase zinc-binding domain-containing protein n=1 Tax=Hibiscus sabdariffa TaxID=183260 RepID=A0ABR2TZG0_9ROSI
MQSSISSRFNFKVVDTLRIYLGVPVIHKRTCCSDYEFIIVKILNKLNGWSARSLYDKWCVNLTRYVLDSLLFHSILCKPVPFLSKCAIPLKFLFVVSFGSTLTTLKNLAFIMKLGNNPSGFVNDDPGIMDLVTLEGLLTSWIRMIPIFSDLHVLWTALHNKLMTNVEHVKRWLSANPSCPECDFHKETILHALRDCPSAKGYGFGTMLSSMVVVPLLKLSYNEKLYKLNYGGLLSGLQVARSLSAKKLLVQSDSSTDECNRVADKITKMFSSNSPLMLLMDAPPTALHDLLVIDVIGPLYCKFVHV